MIPTAWDNCNSSSFVGGTLIVFGGGVGELEAVVRSTRGSGALRGIGYPNKVGTLAVLYKELERNA